METRCLGRGRASIGRGREVLDVLMLTLDVRESPLDAERLALDQCVPTLDARRFALDTPKLSFSFTL